MYPSALGYLFQTKLWFLFAFSPPGPLLCPGFATQHWQDGNKPAMGTVQNRKIVIILLKGLSTIYTCINILCFSALEIIFKFYNVSGSLIYFKFYSIDFYLNGLVLIQHFYTLSSEQNKLNPGKILKAQYSAMRKEYTCFCGLQKLLSLFFVCFCVKPAKDKQPILFQTLSNHKICLQRITL